MRGKMFVCRQKRHVLHRSHENLIRKPFTGFLPPSYCRLRGWLISSRRKKICNNNKRNQVGDPLHHNDLLKIGGVIDVDDTHQWAKDNLAERLYCEGIRKHSLLFGRDGCRPRERRKEKCSFRWSPSRSYIGSLGGRQWTDLHGKAIDKGSSTFGRKERRRIVVWKIPWFISLVVVVGFLTRSHVSNHYPHYMMMIP